MTFRTDRNNNPAAFTVQIAEEAGLQLGLDYEQGDPFFVGGHQYFTAKLLKDPVALTIAVIDKISFYTMHGQQRWIYIAMPHFVWNGLQTNIKKEVIAFMYSKEGGSALKNLFNENENLSGHIEVGITDKLDIKGT